jgi:hypothetical protein
VAEKEESIGILVTTNKDNAKPILETCFSVDLPVLFVELLDDFWPGDLKDVSHKIIMSGVT